MELSRMKSEKWLSVEKCEKVRMLEQGNDRRSASLELRLEARGSESQVLGCARM